MQGKTVCVVGLGYVGLPLALAFARAGRVVGFDIDAGKVEELRASCSGDNLLFTCDPREIHKGDYILIAVPTPVTESKEPDLSYVEKAARLVGQNLKRGSVVILESTVYPGVTEEVVKPILEESGLRCGPDFKLAYSPERINPGDEEHTLGKVTKVVGGLDAETTDMVAELYSRVAGKVFKTRDIRTAEAAKVIENVQRDLNIALMNELSLIFHRMGLTTEEVLEAASTKWNFHRYHPGLVGGHCIPVDPYYLVHKARALGYHAKVILAGREINDYMPKHVAEMAVKALIEANKLVKGARVLIMGLTYKENVADTRESPAKHIIRELQGYGVKVLGYDPWLPNIREEFGIEPLKTLEEAKGLDATIVTVAHDDFKAMTLERLRSIMNERPILIDVRHLFPEEEAVKVSFIYRTL